MSEFPTLLNNTLGMVIVFKNHHIRGSQLEKFWIQQKLACFFSKGASQDTEIKYEKMYSAYLREDKVYKSPQAYISRKPLLTNYPGQLELYGLILGT